MTDGLVSAVQLGISPEEIKFDLDSGELGCRNISIFSKGYNGNIILEDRWEKEGESNRILGVHNLTSLENDIRINYTRKFRAKSKSEVSVCIVANNGGFYHGIIIALDDKDKGGVGSWISLNVSGEMRSESPINAYSIEEEHISYNPKSPNRGLLIVESGFIGILMILAVFLVLFRRRKARIEY